MSHRPFTYDLFNEFEGPFEPIPYVTKSTFYGYVLSSNGHEAEIRASNPFIPGDEFELICPYQNGKIVNDRAEVIEISENGNAADMARPDRLVSVRFDRPVAAD